MPLYIRRRRDTGALEIYGTVRPAGEKTGIRVRVRAGSDDEATAREEAIAYEREILRNFHLGERPDVRSFAEAVRSYVNHETRSTRTVDTALRLVRYFGTMRLDQINQEVVDKARAILLRPGAAPATVTRNLIGPLRAILTHAADQDWCAPPRIKAPSIGRRPPQFLLPAEVEALIGKAAPHLKPLLRFLVCTGCRLGEALALEWRSVDLAGRRVTLWEGETKSGRRRVIDLVPAAEAALRGLDHRVGRVFLTQRKRPYPPSEVGGGQIKTAWARACGEAGLAGEWHERPRPDRPGVVRVFRPAAGPHVLRHTWASWTYALNPDPLALMAAGGWSDLKLVERYAHLIPAGHAEGIRRVWGLEVRKEMRA